VPSPPPSTSPDPTLLKERSPLPRNVVLLGWTSLLNDIASEMLFPLLPQFLLLVLGGNKAYLGLIDGLAETTSSVLKLWSGAWSDSAGRRKGFVLFGYGVAAIARPLISLAAAPWHLLALRTLDRVGKGVRTSPRDALIAESTAPGSRGRAFGFNRAMDHLGAAIGPLLAFAFLYFWPNRLRLLFALAIVPAIPILVLLYFGLEERSGVQTAKKDEPFTLTMRPFDRRFRLYLASLLLFTLGNSSDSFLLVRAGELGVSTAWLPVLWCVFHVAKSGLTNAVGPWIDRLGARPLIWLGWLIYAATYLAFAFASQAWHVWALFLVYSIYYALAEPSEKTLVADLVGASNRGLAYGWFNLTIGIGALPASVVFGIVYQWFGALAAFGMGAMLALTAALLLIGVQPKKGNAQERAEKNEN
jgi:MFS family permease